MFIFEPQCHTLVTFFLNLPIYNVCKSTLQGFWAYTMLEEMHDPVLSQPIFVKAMSSQVRAISFVIWKIFVYVQMCVVTSATGTM